jgi:hypothetical protein
MDAECNRMNLEFMDIDCVNKLHNGVSKRQKIFNDSVTSHHCISFHWCEELLND